MSVNRPRTLGTTSAAISPRSIGRLRELRFWLAFASLLAAAVIGFIVWRAVDSETPEVRLLLVFFAIACAPAVFLCAREAAALFAFGSAPRVDAAERAIRAEANLWAYAGALVIAVVIFAIVLVAAGAVR
jgi:hypothetical protein